MIWPPALQTWNLSNVLHQQDSHVFKFTQEQRIFGKKIEKRGCPTHLFLIICPFLCNYLVLKYIERVIFFVKFYLNPKEFYTRAARNKFHVCCTVSSCGVEFVLSCFVHGMKKFQGFGPKLAINQSQSIIQPN